MPAKLLGVLGTENHQSTTARYFHRALYAAEQRGVATKVLCLQNIFGQVRNATLTTEVQPNLRLLTEAVLDHDGLLIAGTVHWYGPCLLVQHFMHECLTPLEMQGFRCKGKAAAVMMFLNDDGGAKACGDVLVPLVHMGFRIAPFGAFYRNSSIAERSEHRWMENPEEVGQELALEILTHKTT